MGQKLIQYAGSIVVTELLLKQAKKQCIHTFPVEDKIRVVYFVGFVVARILDPKRVKPRRIIREEKKFNVISVCFSEVNSSSSYKPIEKIPG